MIGNQDRLIWGAGMEQRTANIFQNQTNNIKELDNELNISRAFNLSFYRDYMYLRHSKKINTDYGTWTNPWIANNTMSQNTSGNWYGADNVKFVRNSAGAGYIGGYANFTSLDLTTFNDGTESTTDDFIILSFYVEDAQDFDYFELRLGTDHYNFKRYTIWYTPPNEGWNSLAIPKKYFINILTVDWSYITYLDIRFYSWEDFTNSIFIFQYIGLQRANLDKVLPNCFQEYNGSSYQYIRNTNFDNQHWLNVLDSSVSTKPVLVNTKQDAMPTLTINQNWKNFYLKGSIYCKIEGYAGGFQYYIDSNNYFYCHVENNTTKFILVLNSVTYTYTSTVGGTLSENDQIVYLFFKQGNILHLAINYSTPSVFIITNPFKNDYGDIQYVIPNPDKFGYLEDCIVDYESIGVLDSGSSLYF